jgi:uncharacterized membrane protein
MKTRPRILLYVLGLVFFISPWVIVFLFVSRVGSLAAGVGAIIGGFFYLLLHTFGHSETVSENDEAFLIK